MQRAAESSPSLTMIGADIDKHSHPILWLFVFGLRFTCCLAKVKNKTFRARLWSVFPVPPQCEGEEGEGEAAAAPRSAPLASRSARTAARAEPEPPRARGAPEKSFSSQN